MKGKRVISVVNKFLQKIQETPLHSYALKGAIGSFGLNIINQIAVLGLFILLARLMSPENFGLYAIILSFVLLLALPFAGGIPVFMIRHISSAMAKNEYSPVKGLIFISFLWVVGGTILISAITFFSLPLFVESTNTHTYRLGLTLCILSPFILWSGSILRGLKRVVIGRVAEFVVQPLFLFGLILFIYLSSKTELTTNDVLNYHILSLFFAAIVSIILIFIYIPRNIYAIPATYEIKKWALSAIPLIFSIGLIVVNANIDILMVGALAGEEEAGQYRVATRLAGFIPFFLFAANNAVGPLISKLHTQKQNVELQKLLTFIARITFIGCMPLLILLIIWPDFILSVLFGDGFAVAATALIILSLANFFSVAMGQVGQVMALTGHEKYTAYAVFASVIVNITLNTLLIPEHGINGAAIATGTSILIWNRLLAYWTREKTGYACSILGKR